MLKYNRRLKFTARNLRSKPTDCEQVLWSRVRRKQILGIQFYRQKPIGRFVVDFYAPMAKLVVEVDGAQHLDSQMQELDAERTNYLEQQGLRVLRFNNRQVLQEMDAVLAVIFAAVETHLRKSPALRATPFVKGGKTLSRLPRCARPPLSKGVKHSADCRAARDLFSTSWCPGKSASGASKRWSISAMKSVSSGRSMLEVGLHEISLQVFGRYRAMTRAPLL
jgi:very-short-patch-repair endonuclease